MSTPLCKTPVQLLEEECFFNRTNCFSAQEKQIKSNQNKSKKINFENVEKQMLEVFLSEAADISHFKRLNAISIS